MNLAHPVLMLGGMTIKYSCPKGDCPPTEHKPQDVTDFDHGGVPHSVCASTCNMTYPTKSFTVVRD